MIRLIARDIRLALRQGADVAMAGLFFVLAASLVPLGIGPDPAQLAPVAGGVVWIAALLANLLALERLLALDHEDGTLDQLLLSGVPAPMLALAKAITHWLLTGLPVVVLSPLIGAAFGLPGPALIALAAGLALGTPALSLIGVIGGALTLGAGRGGVLLALIVLPLYVPPLIFGAAAVAAALDGRPPGPHLLLQAALSVLALVGAPFAAGAALREAARS